MATTGKALTRAERLQKALDLRVLNQSYTTIGDHLGITKQAAHKLVKRYLDKTKVQTDESAETVKALELLRLDRMAAAALPKAIAGNPDYAAMDRVLKIMERRAKMLGTDQPDKIANTDPTGTTQAPDPYDKALAAIADFRRQLEEAEADDAAGDPPASP